MKDPFLTLMQEDALIEQVGPPAIILQKMRRHIIPSVISKFNEKIPSKDPAQIEHYTLMMFAAFTDLFFRCFGAQLEGNPTYFLDHAHEVATLSTEHFEKKLDEILKSIDEIEKNL